MIAYDNQSLDHILIRDAAGNARKMELISGDEAAAITAAYPVKLYMPDLFIRIGLFVLTAVIASLGFGLFVLTIAVFSEMATGVLSALYALGLYAVLEFVIREKKHYRSGLDDALLWLCNGFLIFAINFFFPLGSLAQALLFCALAVYATLRFADALVAGVAFVSLLAAVFYLLLPLGITARIVLPFVMSLISLLVYGLAMNMGNRNRFRHYRTCLIMLRALSLVAIYGALNFFVVMELSRKLLDLRMSAVPGGWLFWCATILLPPIYIIAGIRQKDVVLLRVGLALLVASGLTVFTYYPVAPPELMMTFAGSLLIVAAYAFSRWLRSPRHGITAMEPNDPSLPGLLQIEALAVSEAFHQSPAVADNGQVEFGGGSGGGGGATGRF